MTEADPKRRPAAIITRAQPGAAETAARAAMEGWRPVISPALEIVWNDALLDVELSGPLNGLLFTSANGVRAFARANIARTVPVWCVGPATTRTAEAAGFITVRNADGNADDLVDMVRREAPMGARLLHVANEAAAGEVIARLNTSGFEAALWPLYRTVDVEALSVEARVAAAKGCAVIIHSAKGAAAFAKAARGLDLSGVIAAAVSVKAAGPLAALDLKDTVIAARPNEDALMAALAGAKLAL